MLAARTRSFACELPLFDTILRVRGHSDTTVSINEATRSSMLIV